MNLQLHKPGAAQVALQIQICSSVSEMGLLSCACCVDIREIDVTHSKGHILRTVIDDNLTVGCGDERLGWVREDNKNLAFVGSSLHHAPVQLTVESVGGVEDDTRALYSQCADGLGPATISTDHHTKCPKISGEYRQALAWQVLVVMGLKMDLVIDPYQLSLTIVDQCRVIHTTNGSTGAPKYEPSFMLPSPPRDGLGIVRTFRINGVPAHIFAAYQFVLGYIPVQESFWCDHHVRTVYGDVLQDLFEAAIIGFQIPTDRIDSDLRNSDLYENTSLSAAVSNPGVYPLITDTPSRAITDAGQAAQAQEDSRAKPSLVGDSSMHLTAQVPAIFQACFNTLRG